MALVFVTLDEVLALHGDVVERYGGAAGIRDVGLLQSALAMPEATFGGELLHASVFEAAAAYLFHLVKNHPFLDGNKRVGLATMILFLGLNDLALTASEDEVVELVTSVAAGRIAKPEIAVFLKTRIVSIGDE